MPFFYLNNKFQKARRDYYRFGFKKTFIKVIKTVFSPIYTQDVDLLLIKKDLIEQMKFTFSYKQEIQRIEKSHLGILREFNEKHDESTGRGQIEIMNDFFENNCDGFIIFLKGDIIGYYWWVDKTTITRRNRPEAVLFNISLEDDDVFSFNFFIAPEYRGNSNSIEALCNVYSALNKLGYKRVFGVVATNNTKAMWLYKLLSCKEVRRIIIRRFFYFVLFVDKAIFLKTSMCYPFDYRALYTFRDTKSLN